MTLALWLVLCAVMYHVLYVTADNAYAAYLFIRNSRIRGGFKPTSKGASVMDFKIPDQWFTDYYQQNMYAMLSLADYVALRQARGASFNPFDPIEISEELVAS